MRATKGLSLASLALSILERFASAWHWAWCTLVVARLMDTSRALTRDAVWGMIHHLYELEARLARAIYKTTRRLAGLPRKHLALETLLYPQAQIPAPPQWPLRAPPVRAATLPPPRHPHGQALARGSRAA